jgi:hypothetical protein
VSNTTGTAPQGNVDTDITAQFGPAPTGSVGSSIPEPGAIGVPKYQTVGGHFVFEGSKYKRVIQGNDGKFYAIDASGGVLTDDQGTPIQDEPQVDRAGSPIRLQAQYATPGTPGSQLPGITSRIEPGSPAAAQQPGQFGPARYQPGDETAIWFGLPAEQRSQVMQAMLDRGIAPSSGTTSGIGQDWVTAFHTILGYANANNLTWDRALASMPMADRTTTKQVSTAQYDMQLTSEADLGAIYKKAVAQLIGGGHIDQGEVDRYVRAYQQMQRNDQEKAIADSERARLTPKTVRVDSSGNVIPDSAPAGTDVAGSLPDSAAAAAGPVSQNPSAIVTERSVPSPEAAAAEQVKREHPAAYQETNMANAYNLFVNAIAGIGRSASTTGSVQ